MNNISRKSLNLFTTISVGLLLSGSAIYAWNGLSADTGDSLTAIKWNELVDKVSSVNTDANGNVGIGISTPESILHISKTATNGNDGYIKHRIARDSSYGGGMHVGRSRGTIENQTALQDGDILYYNSAAGHDGTIYKPSAILTRYVDGEVSDGVVSGAFSFDTYFNGNRRDSFDIRANGYIGIGTVDPKADLHIVTTGTGAKLMLGSVHNDNALTPEIQLRANNGNNPKIGVASAHTYDAELGSYIQFINEGPYARKGIGFFTKQTANYAGTEVGTDVFERMRIGIDGDIGIGTSDPKAKLDVDGVALSNFEGFSYKATGLSLSTGWQNIIIPDLDYNSFTGTPYNTGTGEFIIPRDGFYRFSLGGYSPINSATKDQRYALGIHVNGVLKGFGGGNLSTPDSPIGTFTQVFYLSKDDVIRPAMFSPVVGSLGHASYVGHEFFFQGEFVGK